MGTAVGAFVGEAGLVATAVGLDVDVGSPGLAVGAGLVGCALMVGIAVGSGRLDTLEYALMRAEPEGYVRCFVDEGAPLQRLLIEAARAAILPDYTARLRRRRAQRLRLLLGQLAPAAG